MTSKDKPQLTFSKAFQEHTGCRRSRLDEQNRVTSTLRSQPGQGFERLYLTPLLDVTARESNSSPQCKVGLGYLL